MTLKLVVGVIVAAAAWGAMFGIKRQGFWTRAALAGAAVGIYATAVDVHGIAGLFATRHWPADLGIGVASGVVFFLAFQIGEQLLVIALPGLADEVSDLYAVKSHTSDRWVIPLVVSIAAVGEEVFFRGLLTHRAGFIWSVVIYAAVHLWERKIILILAALLGGLFWGGLFVWTGGLVAPATSHLLWGLMIIVWRPARPSAWARRTHDRLAAARHRA